MNRLQPKKFLGLFIVGLLGSSALLGVYASRSQSNPSQVEQPDMTMTFRFENYNSAEETKAALTKLFPPGT